MQGYGQAKVKLGIIYETGVPFGVEEDFEKAWKLYLDAAALKMLADCYRYGKGVVENIEKEWELLETAYEEAINHD